MKHQRTFIFSLVMLMLVALTACAQVSQADRPLEVVPQQSEAAPVVLEENETHSDSEVFAANPELMAADRYVTEPKDGALTDSDFYAANPELMIADRYPAAIAKRVMASNSTFFATNPELMVAGRYQDAVRSETISASTFFAVNPELMIAHRYAAAE